MPKEVDPNNLSAAAVVSPSIETEQVRELAQTPANWVPGVIALGMALVGLTKLSIEAIKHCRSHHRSDGKSDS